MANHNVHEEQKKHIMNRLDSLTEKLKNKKISPT